MSDLDKYALATNLSATERRVTRADDNTNLGQLRSSVHADPFQKFKCEKCATRHANCSSKKAMSSMSTPQLQYAPFDLPVGYQVRLMRHADTGSRYAETFTANFMI